jgi:hypothetical protein
MINNMNIQPLFSGVPNAIQGGVLAPPGYQPSLANYQPGHYSQLAYQMAGSPSMGPWAASAPPPLQPYSTGGVSGGGGSAASSAVGLLNDVNKAKNLYNNVSGLLHPGVTPSDLSSLYSQSAPASDAVQPLITTPAQAGITDIQGPLYSGATNADADLAAQEADNYAANGGLLAATSAPAADAATSATDAGLQAVDASGAVPDSISPDVANSIDNASNSGASSALPIVGDIYGIYSGLKQGDVGGDAQAAYDAYKLYQAYQGTTAATAASAAPASSSGLGVAGGTAAAIAIPAAIAIAGLQNQQTNSGLAFTKSLGNVVNGKYGGMFTQDQYNQIQQQYHNLGEDGFWQWFQKTYPGFTGPGTSNVRASYKPD